MGVGEDYLLEEFVRKSLSRSEKKKNFLLMKPIEQRNVFGLFMEMVKEIINNMTVSRC